MSFVLVANADDANITMQDIEDAVGKDPQPFERFMVKAMLDNFKTDVRYSKGKNTAPLYNSGMALLKEIELLKHPWRGAPVTFIGDFPDKLKR
jgi:hypothetical protein